jgi:hypothetical protein
LKLRTPRVPESKIAELPKLQSSQSLELLNLKMLMDSLKATTVRKGGNIKPAVIADGSLQYNPLEDHDIDDPKLVEDMVRNIEQLDRTGHEQIYMALRRTKPKKFFAANNVDTRFNIYGLSICERQELRRIIRLCMEDKERKKVLNEATGSYREEIEKLDQKLHIGDLDDPFVDATSACNPSEAEKIKEMLQMNA